MAFMQTKYRKEKKEKEKKITDQGRAQGQMTGTIFQLQGENSAMIF